MWLLPFPHTFLFLFPILIREWDDRYVYEEWNRWSPFLFRLKVLQADKIQFLVGLSISAFVTVLKRVRHTKGLTNRGYYFSPSWSSSLISRFEGITVSRWKEFSQIIQKIEHKRLLENAVFERRIDKACYLLNYWFSAHFCPDRFYDPISLTLHSFWTPLKTPRIPIGVTLSRFLRFPDSIGRTNLAQKVVNICRDLSGIAFVLFILYLAGFKCNKGCAR